MKATTKKALDRAAAHMATLNHVGGLVALLWVDGEGTPRSPLTWTHEGELHPDDYTFTRAELEHIASRLQRMEGPRGRRIKAFVVGMRVTFANEEEE